MSFLTFSISAILAIEQSARRGIKTGIEGFRIFALSPIKLTPQKIKGFFNLAVFLASSKLSPVKSAISNISSFS